MVKHNHVQIGTGGEIKTGPLASFVLSLHNLVICYSFLQISGTAMVLDEIINHVQSLQRQVEVSL